MPHKPPPPTRAELRDALRHLRARPPAHPLDLSNGRLPGAVERAVRRVEELRPNVAAAVPRFVLVAAAHVDPPEGGCRTCLARLEARRYRQRLKLTPTGRFLLGPRCLGCRRALDPPKPKPKPKPKRRQPAPRSSTSTSSTRTRTAPPARRPRVDLPMVASTAGQPSPGITPAQAAYNRQRGAALRLPPERIAHLTTATAR